MNIFFMSRSWRRRWIYPFISLTVAFSLWFTSAVRTPAFSLGDLLLQGVQVLQLSNLSDQQEVELGKQMNQQLLSREFRLYQNSEVTNYVNQVGQRLIPRSERPNLPYTFQVVDDRDINAFATMGGFVYVTTGLLKAADNEAQLAGVLGHEMGHIAARHLVEQMKQTAIQRGIAGIAGIDQSVAAGIGVELLLNRPNSRQAEFEADQLGLRTMTRAGYAPSGMVEFMKKLINQSSTPDFLSTHPGTQDRINALQRSIDPGRVNSGDGLNPSSYQSRVKSFLR